MLDGSRGGCCPINSEKPSARLLRASSLSQNLKSLIQCGPIIDLQQADSDALQATAQGSKLGPYMGQVYVHRPILSSRQLAVSRLCSRLKGWRGILGRRYPEEGMLSIAKDKSHYEASGQVGTKDLAAEEYQIPVPDGKLLIAQQGALKQDLLVELMSRLGGNVLKTSARDDIVSLEWMMAKDGCQRISVHRGLKDAFQHVVALGDMIGSARTKAHITALKEVLGQEIKMQETLLQHLECADFHCRFREYVQSEDSLMQAQGAAMLALISDLQLIVKDTKEFEAILETLTESLENGEKHFMVVQRCCEQMSSLFSDREHMETETAQIKSPAFEGQSADISLAEMNKGLQHALQDLVSAQNLLHALVTEMDNNDAQIDEIQKGLGDMRNYLSRNVQQDLVNHVSHQSGLQSVHYLEGVMQDVSFLAVLRSKRFRILEYATNAIQEEVQRPSAAQRAITCAIQSLCLLSDELAKGDGTEICSLLESVLRTEIDAMTTLRDGTFLAVEDTCFNVEDSIFSEPDKILDFKSAAKYIRIEIDAHIKDLISMKRVATEVAEILALEQLHWKLIQEELQESLSLQEGSDLVYLSTLNVRQVLNILAWTEKGRRKARKCLYSLKHFVSNPREKSIVNFGGTVTELDRAIFALGRFPASQHEELDTLGAAETDPSCSVVSDLVVASTCAAHSNPIENHSGICESQRSIGIGDSNSCGGGGNGGGGGGSGGGGNDGDSAGDDGDFRKRIWQIALLAMLVTILYTSFGSLLHRVHRSRRRYSAWLSSCRVTPAFRWIGTEIQQSSSGASHGGTMKTCLSHHGSLWPRPGAVSQPCLCRDGFACLQGYSQCAASTDPESLTSRGSDSTDHSKGEKGEHCHTSSSSDCHSGLLRNATQRMLGILREDPLFNGKAVTDNHVSDAGLSEILKLEPAIALGLGEEAEPIEHNFQRLFHIIMMLVEFRRETASANSFVLNSLQAELSLVRDKLSKSISTLADRDELIEMLTAEIGWLDGNIDQLAGDLEVACDKEKLLVKNLEHASAEIGLAAAALESWREQEFQRIVDVEAELADHEAREAELCAAIKELEAKETRFRLLLDGNDYAFADLLSQATHACSCIDIEAVKLQAARRDLQQLSKVVTKIIDDGVAAQLHRPSTEHLVPSLHEAAQATSRQGTLVKNLESELQEVSSNLLSSENSKTAFAAEIENLRRILKEKDAALEAQVAKTTAIEHELAHTKESMESLQSSRVDRLSHLANDIKRLQGRLQATELELAAKEAAIKEFKSKDDMYISQTSRMNALEDSMNSDDLTHSNALALREELRLSNAALEQEVEKRQAAERELAILRDEAQARNSDPAPQVAKRFEEVNKDLGIYRDLLAAKNKADALQDEKIERLEHDMKAMVAKASAALRSANLPFPGDYCLEASLEATEAMDLLSKQCGKLLDFLVAKVGWLQGALAAETTARAQERENLCEERDVAVQDAAMLEAAMAGAMDATENLQGVVNNLLQKAVGAGPSLPPPISMPEENSRHQVFLSLEEQISSIFRDIIRLEALISPPSVKYDSSKTSSS